MSENVFPTTTEDEASVDGQQGIASMAVRNDADATLTDADGDESRVSVDASGKQKVRDDALLTAFNAEDFATETTLATMLTEATFAAEDFATQTTLEAARVLIDSLDTKFDVNLSTRASEATVATLLTEATFAAEDFATQTTLEAARVLLASLDAKDFATEATLQDVEAELVRQRSTVATFGDLISTARQDQLSVNFSETTPQILVDTTSTGTGSVTNVTAQSIVSSGTTATSTAKMNTRRTIFYFPGHEAYAYFTATFSEPTANGSQFIGLFDDDNGFAIGYAGTTFCVRRRTGGTDFDIPLGSFNGDLLTEFMRDGVVETLDPQLGNIYRIRFGWLGNAPIVFEILSPDDEWVVLHTIKYPNTSTAAHIENPDLPLTSEVSNGADAVDVSIATSSWSAGAVRVETGPTVIFQRKTSDGTLPAGGTPTIDPVFNNDANVIDSGWIRTIDYPGGNFINITGDQGLDVYLMNASDAQGSDIVGDGAPSIQTTAGIPATISAPYFDDYYRVLISNQSGSTLTSYSIYNRGHTTSQQGLSLGVEQTLLSFFSAALSRAILAAKNDAGFYGNILRSDLGGLRMSILEQEAELMAKSTNTQSQTSLTASSTFAQIDASKLSNRKYYVISNHDNNTNAFYGNGAGTTTLTGTILPPETTHVIETTGDIDIYVGTSSGTAALSFHQHGGTV